MKQFIELAFDLIELELESIHQNAEYHFMFSNWTDKFGENSYKLSDKLDHEYEPTKLLVLELAKEIKKDFDTNYWQVHTNGALYSYMMPTIYGGEIDNIIEIQLADLTRIGTQQKIEYS